MQKYTFFLLLRFCHWVWNLGICPLLLCTPQLVVLGSEVYLPLGKWAGCLLFPLLSRVYFGNVLDKCTRKRRQELFCEIFLFSKWRITYISCVYTYVCTYTYCNANVTLLLLCLKFCFLQLTVRKNPNLIFYCFYLKESKHYYPLWILQSSHGTYDGDLKTCV